MSTANHDTIAKLRKEILALQGLARSKPSESIFPGWGVIDQSFPDSKFPCGAIHEFLCPSLDNVAPTSGFIAALLAALMKKGGPAVWIGCQRTLFPYGLAFFDLDPDRIIFIDVKNEKDLLWSIEEALKTDGIAAVIGEVKDMSFTASRRLQLAVESSKVTGMIIRKKSGKISTTASVTQWHITSLSTQAQDGLPGLAMPRWKVQLLKVRNGRPGTWNLEWTGTRLQHIPVMVSLRTPQKKTG